jgi:eukaryotic-like serine/threonine-protein kinase
MSDQFDLAPAEWATLRRLLDDALDHPPAERETWLAHLDAQFDAFKPRLRALLQHAAGGTGALPLDTLPKVETAQFLAERRRAADALQAGVTVGPYRLVRPLGEGGMGEVWLAERSDMLQRRKVALKLPRLLTGRAALAERMAREREILAGLNHPNIARLYDAGLTADGQPYLALEYVEGERIDAYCQRKALEVPARLRLVLQVARAVAHAHANLVVHRDLKPANILVTETGEVRLLDFGIAKLLDAGRAQETELTQLAGRALTPDYAAPEQILGQPIGTAADVYALGVVLFELLTGSRPYQLKRDSRAALEEAIVLAQVQRPSSVVTEVRLRKQLRGDLDTIVLKALKRAPAERYGSVEALADDIERHLDQRPVRAQPDSTVYRARKFLLRNQVAAAATAVVVLALVTGSGIALWQARIARAEQLHAEEVKNFVTSVFRYADPFFGGSSTSTTVDLLKQAAARIDEIAATQPRTRVEILALLGQNLVVLGDAKAAFGPIDRAVEEARRHLADDDPVAIKARLARLQALRFRGDADQMRREADELVPLLRRAGDPQALVMGLKNRAHAAIDQGQYAVAEANSGEALALARVAYGPDDPITLQVAMLHAMTLLFGEPRPTQALAAAEEAMALALKVFASDPAHPEVSDARHLLGRALNAAGQSARAVEILERAVADTQRVVGAEHRKLAFMYNTLGIAQRRAGLLPQALASADAAVGIASRHFAPDTWTYAAALGQRGTTRLAARQTMAAQSDLAAAADVARRRQGERHPATLNFSHLLARARAEAGEPQASAEELQALITRFDHVSDELPAPAWHSLGIAQRLAGDHGAAIDSQRRALALFGSGAHAALDRELAQVEIGISDLERGRHAEAIAALTRSIDIMRTLQSESTPQLADAQLALGRALLAKGRPADALVPLQAASAYWQTRQAMADKVAISRWQSESERWLGQARVAAAGERAARPPVRRASR